MKSWEEEEKPEPKHCCLDFIKTLATKEEVFGLCEKSSASPSTNEAYIVEMDDLRGRGLAYNSLFRSFVRLRAVTFDLEASADDIKYFFKKKSGLSVTVYSQGVIKEPKGDGIEIKEVNRFTVLFESNEDLLMGTELNGQLLAKKPKKELLATEPKEELFPLFLQRIMGRLCLFSVTGYNCALSKRNLKAQLAKIFVECKHLVNSIVHHDQTKPGYLVEISYLIFHVCQEDLMEVVLKKNSTLLSGKMITVEWCSPNLKHFNDHENPQVTDNIGCFSNSKITVNPKPSKKRAYEDTTGTDKGVKKSKRSSEKEMEVGDTSDSKKAELDTEKSCKCCEYLTKALPTLLTKDDLKDVFGKWERKWSSVLDTWRENRPDIMPCHYTQKEGNCSTVALFRHWYTLWRLSGCTTTPELTMEKISEGVPLRYQTIWGQIRHFMFARDFLIQNEYIDDMKVHSRPEDKREWENFEQVIDELLAKGPLAVAIDEFDSYASKSTTVLSPTSTERVRARYEGMLGHALLLVGKGVDLTGERPKRFYELFQSYGAKYGRGGFVRLARGEGLIHTAVEMTLSAKKRASGMEAGDTSESKKAAESPENANQEQFNNSGKQLGSKNKGKGRA